MDVEKLKQKILDLAIRGKLVPQDPNDEPASVLVEKIRAEKQKLIKEGKIKPSKNEFYIYKGSDNLYYENDRMIQFDEPLNVAPNFVWLKGKDILLSMESKKPSGTSFQYIDIDSIDNKSNTINFKEVKTNNAPSRASRKVYKESTVFSMVRPYLRNIAFVGQKNENAIASTGFYVCTPLPFVCPKYLFLLMKSDYVVNGLNFYMKGDNSPSINGCDIENFLFPIPSKQYQERVISFFEQIELKLETLRKDFDELQSLALICKQKLLGVVFGENSSYKSYYCYTPLEKEIITVSLSNKKVKTKEVLKQGKYKVVSQSKNDYDGFTNDEDKIIHDLPCVVFGDHTRIVKKQLCSFAPGADGTKVIKPKNLNIDYFYYCVLYASLLIENRGYGRHFALLKKQIIPIANEAIQIKVVNFIDESFKLLDNVTQ